MTIPDISFISVQYGNAAGEVAELNMQHGLVLTHWQDVLDDYDQTASLIQGLDLVITVCTAAVHLSGGLGRQVWVLVPSRAEWRYGIDAVGMPWYPSARLFRQQAQDKGEWEPTVNRVAQALRRMLDTL